MADNTAEGPASPIPESDATDGEDDRGAGPSTSLVDTTPQPVVDDVVMPAAQVLTVSSTAGRRRRRTEKRPFLYRWEVLLSAAVGILSVLVALISVYGGGGSDDDDTTTTGDPSTSTTPNSSGTGPTSTGGSGGGSGGGGGGTPTSGDPGPGTTRGEHPGPTVGPTSPTTPGPGPSVTSPPVQKAEVPGVLGEYYDNLDFTGTRETRLDADINFDFAERSPLPNPAFDVDTYSIRWTGELQVDVAGVYDLIVTSDDGARLWIDGVLVIDAWSDHTVRDDQVSRHLSAGRHALRMEYYENAFHAVARLSWAGPGIGRRHIPQSNLFTY